ncbi:MAG: hypothetical protein WBB86_05035 [Candidatus Omnitrophota bacterium]
MAVKVDVYNQAYAIDQPMSDVPVFMRFLGEGRSIVSSLSLLQADRYFHGGAGHFSDEHKEGFAIAEREHTACEHPDEHILPEASPFNVLFRISREIGVTEHVHLQGDQVKEIVPWLYYAAEIDPHNVLAYTLTGFYLCDRLGKIDQGIAFLREGLRKNPDSWEINAELGRVYFQHLKNYKIAAQYLSKAWVLLQEVPHDKYQERYVLSFLAVSYEALGRGSDALPLYRRLNELFPNDVHDKKIKELSLFY